MIVNLNDQYRVYIDEYNHTLQEFRDVPPINSKTGKPNKKPGPNWFAVSYHPNLGQSVAKVVKEWRGQDDTEMSLQEYAQWLDDKIEEVTKWKSNFTSG